MLAAGDVAPAWSEQSFRGRVSELAATPAGSAELVGLLPESHPAYQGRSSAATARMRAWLLSALWRHGLPDAAMIFVLEELDTGRSPVLVASAARALRSASQQSPAMAPFLLAALCNIRDVDDYVDLDCYGGVAGIDVNGTAFAEVLASLRWLGAQARGVLGGLDLLATGNDRPLSPEQLDDVDRTVQLIRAQASAAGPEACCVLPREWGAFRRWLRGSTPPVQTIEFEDQDGERVAYREFFSGRPAVVVFFYTRCDNAQKCSLTVSKLAQVQHLLGEAGMQDRIRTAAITYDPQFDLAPRLRGYAKSRGVVTNTHHRVLRAVSDMDAVQAHFKLGVNFVGSLVNRHRIEAYLVDDKGHIAASFEHLRWDVQQVVAQALALLEPARAALDTQSPLPHRPPGPSTPPASAAQPQRGHGRGSGRAVIGPALSVALALFPKCPLCGATYLSLSGIVAVPQMPGHYWLYPVLALMLVVNLGSLWLQARARQRWSGFGLAAAGAVLMLTASTVRGLDAALPVGAALAAMGSVLGVMAAGRPTATRSRHTAG